MTNISSWSMPGTFVKHVGHAFAVACFTRILAFSRDPDCYVIELNKPLN
ncbi:MAG: hypothetical protein QMC48_03265 [SAR324 cluster bacterium]